MNVLLLTVTVAIAKSVEEWGIMMGLCTKDIERSSYRNCDCGYFLIPPTFASLPRICDVGQVCRKRSFAGASKKPHSVPREEPPGDFKCQSLDSDKLKLAAKSGTDEAKIVAGIGFCHSLAGCRCGPDVKVVCEFMQYCTPESPLVGATWKFECVDLMINFSWIVPDGAPPGVARCDGKFLNAGEMCAARITDKKKFNRVFVRSPNCARPLEFVKIKDSEKFSRNRLVRFEDSKDKITWQDQIDYLSTKYGATDSYNYVIKDEYPDGREAVGMKFEAATQFWSFTDIGYLKVYPAARDSKTYPDNFSKDGWEICNVELDNRIRKDSVFKIRVRLDI